jgi:FkbM family methyltransferase
MKKPQKLSLFWLIKNSLILDFKFWKVSKWPISKKIVFLLKKYYLLFLLQTGIKDFSLGTSFVKLFGKNVFFDCRFGLADYQSVLTRLQNMANIANINSAHVVLDIGANVGFFSMLIRDRFPKATIYAIEPGGKTFQALESNFRDDDKTVLFHKAISNFCGSAKMAFNRDDSARSHLINENVLGSQNETVKEIEAQTLDSFVKEHNIDTVDILKVDVETFEKHVLEEARKTLKKTHYLFLEITSEDNDNYTFSELVSLLYRKDYYNYQLRAFRNFLDKGEGKMPIADFLFENICFCL